MQAPVQFACLDLLVEVCNPFVLNPWSNDLITLEMISNAIKSKQLKSEPYEPGNHWSDDEQFWPIEDHINRIAFLVVHGWDDPISIDVGIPALGYHPEWPVTDGNHRLAAAIYRGDSFIKAQFCGCEDAISKLLYAEAVV